MPQPELDGVRSGQRRCLVHERFECENIRVGTKRAQRGNTHRHIRQQVVDRLLLRENIKRYGVAIAAAGRLRNVARRARRERFAHVPRCEQIAAIRVTGSRAVGVTPQLVLPVDNPAIGVQRSAKVDRHGRTIRLPGEFVVPHPLKLYRAARQGTCEQGGIKRYVVGAVVTVTARAFAVRDHDILDRDAQRFGKVGAQRKHTLGMAPDVQASVLPLRHRARRSDRTMRLERARVARFKFLDARRGGRAV